MKKTGMLIVLFLVAVPITTLADGIPDYKAHCAGCHGTGGMASTRKAKAMNVDFKKLSLTVSSMSKEEMIATIEKGRGKMPDFEKELTKEQISAIVDYIIALSKR